MQPSYLINDIYSRIIEASSLELQIKLWLNQNNDTGSISSYVELMCSLFGDFSFEDFINNGAAKLGFPEDLINEFKKLRDLLRAYKEKDRDEDIINDPEWWKVVEQAKITRKMWETQAAIKPIPYKGFQNY